ncbi:hypothetical protein NPIL_303251 [Nephila pilipes]|uniref:Uncharacterized protein n=1 Tax=Nephila pilipes TaxID=299642 RepID=A0A8X6T999_NEPPI|nr:hypothetical protein NPIL_303251 [Nephila pilipes]
MGKKNPEQGEKTSYNSSVADYESQSLFPLAFSLAHPHLAFVLLLEGLEGWIGMFGESKKRLAEGFLSEANRFSLVDAVYPPSHFFSFIFSLPCQCNTFFSFFYHTPNSS